MERRPAHDRLRRRLLVFSAAWLVLVSVSASATAAQDLAARVGREVRSFLLARAGNGDAEVSLEVPARSGLHGRNAEDARIVVSTSRRGRLVGRVPVTVRLVDEGEILERHVMTASVEVHAEVWVADRRIRRGELISESDLRRERLSVKRGRGRLVVDAGDVIGMRARRSIGAGTPIRRGFVEVPPVVQRGEMVRLRMVHGGLRIETKGVAREDGRAGQVIRVQNTTSRRELTGTVGADGVINVRF